MAPKRVMSDDEPEEEEQEAEQPRKTPRTSRPSTKKDAAGVSFFMSMTCTNLFCITDKENLEAKRKKLEKELKQLDSELRRKARETEQGKWFSA